MSKKYIQSYLVNMRHFIAALYRFTRYRYFFYTAMLPLLGAASVSTYITTYKTLLTLLCVALAYHTFAYVLNDIIDLPIDKNVPSRANYPLVCGQISTKQALFFALMQILLVFWLTIWQGGGIRANVLIGAGFLFMSCYNLLGKHCFFPPLTDLVQGLAWGLLVLYGAVMVHNQITDLTMIIFAFEILFIIYVNGAPGGIRDLNTDLKNGAYTTPIFLGVRVDDDCRLVAVPGRFTAYAMILYSILIGLILLTLARNDVGYDPLAWNITFSTILALLIFSFVLTWKMLSLLYAQYKPGNFQKLCDIGWKHTLTILTLPAILFFLPLNLQFLFVMLSAFAFPQIITKLLDGPLRYEIWENNL